MDTISEETLDCDARRSSIRTSGMNRKRGSITIACNFNVLYSSAPSHLENNFSHFVLAHSERAHIRTMSSPSLRK